MSGSVGRGARADRPPARGSEQAATGQAASGLAGTELAGTELAGTELAGTELAGPVLGIEASTSRPSIALIAPRPGDGAGRGGGGGAADEAAPPPDLLDLWVSGDEARGAAPLAAAIAGLLARHGLRVADLGGVAVGTGPGSYTGLRAAIALARALVVPARRPLVGVPSVQAAALAALRAAPDVRDVVVLVDARRGQLYRAEYRRRSAPPAPRAAPGAAAIVLDVVQAPCLVPDDRAVPAPRPDLLVVREPLPSAYDVAALGRARLAAGGDDPAHVLPLYLKRSHAEIALEERTHPT